MDEIRSLRRCAPLSARRMGSSGRRVALVSVVMARPLDHRGGGHVNLPRAHNSPRFAASPAETKIADARDHRGAQRAGGRERLTPIGHAAFLRRKWPTGAPAHL